MCRAFYGGVHFVFSTGNNWADLIQNIIKLKFVTETKSNM